MRSERLLETLGDIAENIALAQSFIEGMSQQQFVDDLRTLYAVVRCLEIISEASRRIPADLKSDLIGIQWRDVATAGNLCRHEYRAVTPDHVWITVKDHLPALQAVVHALIAARSED